MPSSDFEDTHPVALSEDWAMAEFPRLVRVAYLLTEDASRAEDMAADAIARVWQRSEQIRIENRPAYLRKTLVNLAMRDRQRRIDQQALQPTNQGLIGQVDIASSTDMRLDVRAALMTIPAKQRAVLVLRYYLDLSEGEIAKLLRISPGTVKSRCFRGVESLRSHLGGPRE